MMKHLKKVLALVIVLTMSLSMVVSAGTIFPDVEDDATYAEATQILKSLNIMIGDENGNFNPDKVVTRAEMAKILCVITGKGDNIAPANSGFADATSAHWASGFIAAAKNAGYINGYSDTAFGPDDTVKWEQAVKLLMAALKYNQMAEDNGGYPEGWIYAAGEADVTGSGAAGTIGEDCTRAKVAMLVYYAIEAKMMKQVTYSNNNKEWIVTPNETLLNKYMDIYKVEGKVTNTYKHDDSLNEGYINYTVTKSNNVDLEDVLGATAVTNEEGAVVSYKFNKIDATGTIAADLLAYSSVAYIEKDAYGDLAIVAIAAKGKRNNVSEIADMGLLYKADRDFNERDTRKPNFATLDGYKFSFWKDRDTDNAISYVKVDNNVLFVINNGAPMTVADILGEDFDGDATAEVLRAITPVRGRIVMVDTNNDDYIDLFEIKDFEVAVVDSVNADRQRINFKSERTFTKSYVSLDKEINTNLREFSITLDGKEIDIADLQEFDVLTISSNDMDDPRYFDIIVSREKVEGKITGIKDTEEKFFIADEDYEIVEGIKNLDFADLKPNDEGVFYLDADGYVAYIDITTVASNNYAYLDYVGADHMGTVTARMLTNEGAKLTVNAADKVKINGVKVALKDVAVTEEEVEGEPVLAYAKLIEMFGAELAADLAEEVGADATYLDVIGAINNEDVVLVAAGLNKFITFKVAGDALTEIDFAYKTGSDVKEFTYVGTVAEPTEWQAELNKFKSSKTLAETAKIFVIDGPSIDDWRVISPAELIDENEYSPYFFSYQNDGTMGAAVVFETSTNINQNGSLAFFKDFRNGIYGEDDTDVVYVSYWTEGALAEETIAVDPDVFGEGMAIGDAFLFGKNDKGIVDELEVIFSPSAAKNAASADVMTIGGLDNFMNLDATAKLDNEVFFGIVAKSSNGRVTLLDYDDLSEVVIPEGEGEVPYKAIEFDNEKILTIPDSAYVIGFNNFASSAKKIVESSVADIMASSYMKTKTNGIKLPVKYNEEREDYVIENEAEQDLSWAFVRLINGEVTEVVAIEYDKK